MHAEPTFIASSRISSATGTPGVMGTAVPHETLVGFGVTGRNWTSSAMLLAPAVST
jgi:hypothetical protein